MFEQLFISSLEILKQEKDKESGTTMEFHRKSGKSVRRVEKSISLSLPIPFAYACVENKIEKAQGIPFRVVHIENFGNKPASFYFNVGISNTKPESSLSLDFNPVVCIRIENDECLGEFFACISRRGYFHVYKGNYCIYILNHLSTVLILNHPCTCVLRFFVFASS